MGTSRHIPMHARIDVERAGRAARELAHHLEFGPEAAESVTLATIELATNLLRYAQAGVILLTPIEGEHGAGIRLESHDEGPGIDDLVRAMEDGFSTGGGMGSGLPGVRRLMDSFTVASDGDGTRVVACKWRKGR